MASSQAKGTLGLEERGAEWLPPNGPSSNGAEDPEPLRSKWTSLLIIIPEGQGFQNISLPIS